MSDPPKRRWYQFSLLALLLAVTAFAIALAAWPYVQVIVLITIGVALMFAPWCLASLFRRIPSLPSWLRQLVLAGVLVGILAAVSAFLSYYDSAELLLLVLLIWIPQLGTALSMARPNPTSRQGKTA